MTLSERRKAALNKCNEVCRREYAKYLDATDSARNEYFETICQIDAEADEIILQKLAGHHYDNT